MSRNVRMCLVAIGALTAVLFLGGSRIAMAKGEMPPVNVGTPLPANWNDYPWEIQHTVKDGEFLYMLAGFYYRDGRKWNWIYETNRDLITNPNKIRPGTVLKIKVPKNWEPMMPYNTWYVRMREQYTAGGGVTVVHTPGTEGEGQSPITTKPEENKK